MNKREHIIGLWDQTNISPGGLTAKNRKPSNVTAKKSVFFFAVFKKQKMVNQKPLD